jgi:peptide/nickel transport system substrate-binding protein
MSRRTSVPRAGAELLVLLAVVGLGGCSGPRIAPESGYHDPHPLPPDTMTVPVRELGVHGGRFVIAQTASPKTFNPLFSNESNSNDVNNLLHAGLSEFDNETEESYPLLARAWDISADGTTYTWHLRRGLRFSDGHPLTSADVLFMFELVYDQVLHPSLQDLLTVDGRPLQVSAPDSFTVVTRAPRPYALMVPAVGSLRILPRHVLEPAYRAGRFAQAYGTGTRPESLVTSGAWRLRTFTQDQRTVLERNPYWFQVDARGGRLPYLDEVVFLIVPDQEAAALKLRAGEVDALDNVKPQDYRSYAEGEARGGYRLYDLGPSLNSAFLWFNLNRVRDTGTRPARRDRRAGDPVVDPVRYRWFSDRTFRRAVSKAIDRDAIIQAVYHGDGVKNWSPLTAGNRHWHDATLTGLDHDPDGARRLLAEAGYRDRDGDGVLEDPDGHTVSFGMKTNADNNVRMAMLNFVRDDLARIGIRVVPEGVAMNTLVSNLREDHQYESCLLGVGTGVPPDPGMAQNVLRSRGALHYWNARQPRPETAAEARIDSLMDVNVSTLDLEVRRSTWREIARILNDECFVVWLPTQRIKVPIRDRFGNLHPTVIPHRILWNIHEVFVRPGTAAR